MENLENYLYILFAVIYIISRIVKARNKQNQSKPRQAQRQAPSSQQTQASSKPKPKKAFTFEDILKEFEKNLSGEEVEHEKPLPVKEIKHERPVTKQEKFDEKKPGPYDSYQGTDFEQSKYKSDKITAGDFERSHKYAIKEKIVNDYRKMLNNPEGFKNAIVLSEIINRKYF